MAEITVDATPFSVVILCPDCSWRAAALNRAAAWRLAAQHLRAAHDDLLAARRAYDAALAAQRRAFVKRRQSPDTGRHGTTRHDSRRAGRSSSGGKRRATRNRVAVRPTEPPVADSVAGLPATPLGDDLSG